MPKRYARQGNRIVWPEKNKVEIERFDVRSPRGAEVLIKTLYTAISPGTESAFLAELPNTLSKFPQYPGYCNVGEVVAKGEKVTKVQIGDKVASHSPHASHVLIPEEQIQPIPDNIPVEEAVFVRLASIALQAVRKGGIELGESTVVLGQGVIGLLALQLAKLSGALPVIGIDLYKYRLDISTKLEADYTFNPNGNHLLDEVKKATEGGAKIVIEATGNPKAIPLALKLTSRYGRVVLLGSTRGESTVNFYSDVHKKGVHIIGAHDFLRPEYESYYRWWTVEDDSKVIFRLLAKGLLKVEDLATLKVSFRKASVAYEEIIQSKDTMLTALLDWTKDR